ncbi:alpha/beta hydrolase [Streptomyces fuscigenes]|uniref:alpha/beta hydrolase n=1 Tax=Streptomyces fuscigenes TaxID=1528880 RepID=UPI001F1A84C6|nr:alpha/beta hydrolase [Streptomyces fuscigenes]MCF3963412.1 alpha/beta hydrolase [Streptomyces fuscigenes]
MGHQAGQGATARPPRPERDGTGPLPRLGRPVVSPPAGTATNGVVLLLPTAAEDSARRPSPFARATLAPLARSLGRAGAAEGVLVHVVRYRFGGWNGHEAAPCADATWAAEEVVRRYGDVPVCLAGHGMGGRAALRAAGHEAVNSALAISPWLPDDDLAAPEEPVRQLVGRQVLIVHGTNDRRTDPELSFRLAERAKKTNRDTCRFEVHADGHALRAYQREVVSLAKDFALGALLSRPYSRPVEDALAAPPPLGLRMPLAAGFGRTLR